MILQAFKSEFERISKQVNAQFTCKEKTEYQDFVNKYDFVIPSINQEPLRDYKSDIGVGGNVFYNGNFELYFIQKIQKNTEQDERDLVIDQMITLQESFMTSLHDNQQLVFQNSEWNWSNTILRQFTSNHLAGVKSRIVFQTQCNRVM